MRERLRQLGYTDEQINEAFKALAEAGLTMDTIILSSLGSPLTKLKLPPVPAQPKIRTVIPKSKTYKKNKKFYK
jgi:hypothetical protein